MFGGAAAALLVRRKEIRRVNEELEPRPGEAPTMDAAARKSLPTLRRDPATDEWRVG